MDVRRWGVGVLAMGLAVALVGCGDDSEPKKPEAAPTEETYPAYAATMSPVEAAMTFVPVGAKTLAVTDYDEVKSLFGLDDVTSRTSPAEQSNLWSRADKGAAQVSGGLLRGVDQRLRDTYKWGAADVVWEARFTGGGKEGFVIKVADRVKPGQAIKAGVGPLKGATFDPKTHLITKHTAAPGTENWAAQEALVAVAGGPATSTYVVNGCAEGGPKEKTRLAPVEAFSVEFGGGLATLRLGEDRDDLFYRLKLGDQDAAYKKVFTHGVADPSTGRIGFRVTSPVTAATLVTSEPVPFAVCD
ncbi:LigA [Nocardioidaceae bacterium Broad-1]|nr:LigA [Nocardioidaceae bacterium Broad-1]